MAATITFGKIETRIRRDLLNDNDAYAYRWGVAAMMSRMAEAVLDIVFVYNAWAGYDQDTKERIVGIREYLRENIQDLCDTTEPSENLDADGMGDQLRGVVIPIDDRYADAIAYITASRLLETDDSDTMNVQKAAQFLETGKGYAER